MAPILWEKIIDLHFCIWPLSRRPHVAWSCQFQIGLSTRDRTLGKQCCPHFSICSDTFTKSWLWWIWLWQIVPDNVLNILRAINVVRFPPLQHQRTSLLAHLAEKTFQLYHDTCMSYAHADYYSKGLFETTSGEFKRGFLILGALIQSPRAAGSVCLLLILVKGGLNLCLHLLVFHSTILLSIVKGQMQ